MNANKQQNITEFEDRALDELARFLILAARSVYQQERETGEDLLAAITKKNDQPKSTK